MDKAAVSCRSDLVHASVIGQIEHHERLPIGVGGDMGHDSIAIGPRPFNSGHRRGQIGHHDAASEPPGGCGHCGCQCATISQMQMPVIGLNNGELIHGICFRNQNNR